MVRYHAPVFDLPSGARTLGVRIGDPVTGPIQEAKGIAFIESIIAPKTTRTVGKFGSPIPVPESMIITCKDALTPIPNGWTQDALFTDEVQADFQLRHDRARGKKPPKAPRIKA